MSHGSIRQIHLERAPDVQLLGDTALLRGAAALDVYRLLTEGIALVRRRDCIEPNEPLLRAVAALKAAAQSGRCVSSEMAEVGELRRPAESASLRSGVVVGASEVAQLLGVGPRQVRHLASSLGGWRGRGRGNPWKFDRGLVQAYIDHREVAQ